MARKKRKNKQNKKKINDNHLIAMLPGMLMSAKKLIEFSDSEWKKELYPGAMATAVIVSAQSAELLLKYKIQREGYPIKPTHDLYNLYKTLKDESKAAIQKEFNEQISKTTPPDGWNSVESVFEKTRNALNWRYAVESTDQPLIYPRALYIAAVSVYRTTPIKESRGVWKEVTDPEVKASVLHKISNR